jgi:hypothetical protein
MDIDAVFLDSLSIEDIEVIEDALGASIDDIFADGAKVPKGKLMRAIAFVVKRKTDETFTIEQAGKLTMGEITRLMDEVGVPPAPLSEGSA